MAKILRTAAPRAGRAAGIAGAKAATFVTDHGDGRGMIVWHGKPRWAVGCERGLQIGHLLHFVKPGEAIRFISCRHSHPALQRCPGPSREKFTRSRGRSRGAGPRGVDVRDVRYTSPCRACRLQCWRQS